LVDPRWPPFTLSRSSCSNFRIQSFRPSLTTTSPGTGTRFRNHKSSHPVQRGAHCATSLLWYLGIWVATAMEHHLIDYSCSYAAMDGGRLSAELRRRQAGESDHVRPGRRRGMLETVSKEKLKAGAARDLGGVPGLRFRNPAVRGRLCPRLGGNHPRHISW